MNKLIIIIKNYVKRLNRLRESRASLSVLRHKRFHLLPHCSLFESPSIYSVLLLYLEFSRMLIVTSPLLTVLIGREGCHWALSMIQFIRGLRSYSIQCEWKDVELQTNQRFRYLHSFLPYWNRTYLRSTSFIWWILHNSHLVSLTWHYSIWNVYHNLVWWIRSFGYLGSKNTNPALFDDNVSLNFFPSRSGPDVGNPNENTTPLAV